MRQSDPKAKLKSLARTIHGLGLLATFVAAVIVQLALFGPIDRRTVSHADQTKELHELSRNELRTRAEHARLARELAAAKQQAALLNKRIPDEPREADFLAQVSGLASQVGLQIDDYRPGEITVAEAYSTMRVDLICDGDYAAICGFVDGLADLTRHSTVVHLQISPSEDPGKADPGKYVLRLSLELYFAGEQHLHVAARSGPNA